MTAITILGRGDDWPECLVRGELWGTATCLLTPGLADKPFSKVFAFDGDNFPEIKKSLGIAKEKGIPVVSTLTYADVLYPIRDICKRFSTSYLMNSVSYMLAYACYQLKKDDLLFIYGIGGRKRWDYEQGRPYIIFWMGVATGLGIEVRAGRGSAQWLYNGTKDLSPRDKTQEEMEAWHHAG